MFSFIVMFLNSSLFQPKPGSKKVSVDELRKRDKELRRVKHELETEKDKFNQMVAKNAADLQNLQEPVISKRRI